MIVVQSGRVQIFDLSSSSLLENVEAHSDSVTTVAMAPDKVICCLCFTAFSALSSRIICGTLCNFNPLKPTVAIWVQL